MERATRGDPRAVEELLERHLPTLMTYVRLHASPVVLARESCSDVVQSVCREVLGSAEHFEYRGEAPFRKWLFQKALSKLMHKRRYWLREKRDVSREQPIPDPGDAGDGAASEVAASFCTPSQIAIRREDLEQLERAFARLPDDYQRVITLSRMIGMSHAEIAAELGRAEGAVRVLLHRALVRLGWLIAHEA